MEPDSLTAHVPVSDERKGSHDLRRQEKAITKKRKVLQNVGICFAIVVTLGAPFGIGFWLFSLFPDSPGGPPLILSIFSILLSIVFPFSVCTIMLNHYKKETERLKQNWLNQYGVQVSATVTRHEVIKEVRRDHETRYTYYIHLAWEDPGTERSYSFKQSINREAEFQFYSQGKLLPVQFDPGDSSFYIVHC
jgi:flagellar basal body-associated protein FliL